MNNQSIFNQIFDDELIIKRIKNTLPNLFQLAELESSRDGKIGMEIGSVRERIIIALLMYKYGIDIVNPKVRITEPEIDVFINNQPLSIKTISTKTQKLGSGIKLIWTVDAQKALSFQKEYHPKCDILLVQIVWGDIGKLYLFSQSSQNLVLQKLGRDRYIKLPKQGTNPRGIELSIEALNLLIQCNDTRTMQVPFERKQVDLREIYTKWLDAWQDEY